MATSLKGFNPSNGLNERFNSQLSVELHEIRCRTWFGLELKVYLNCSMLRDAKLGGYKKTEVLQQKELSR